MVQLESCVRHLVGHHLTIKPARLLAGNFTFFNDNYGKATFDQVDRRHEPKNARANDDYIRLLGQLSLSAPYKTKPWFAGDQPAFARQQGGQNPRAPRNSQDATADQKLTPRHSHDTFLSWYPVLVASAQTARHLVARQPS